MRQSITETAKDRRNGSSTAVRCRGIEGANSALAAAATWAWTGTAPAWVLSGFGFALGILGFVFESGEAFGAAVLAGAVPGMLIVRGFQLSPKAFEELGSSWSDAYSLGRPTEAVFAKGVTSSAVRSGVFAVVGHSCRSTTLRSPPNASGSVTPDPFEVPGLDLRKSRIGFHMNEGRPSDGSLAVGQRRVERSERGTEGSRATGATSSSGLAQVAVWGSTTSPMVAIWRPAPTTVSAWNTSW